MKLICTPLSKKAMSLLDVDACPSTLLERLLLTNSEYLQLEKSGLFDIINTSLKKNIDDYEDEYIVAHKELEQMLETLKKHSLPENPKLLEKLISINESALDKETGVFFYF